MAGDINSIYATTQAYPQSPSDGYPVPAFSASAAQGATQAAQGPARSMQEASGSNQLPTFSWLIVVAVYVGIRWLWIRGGRAGGEL